MVMSLPRTLSILAAAVAASLFSSSALSQGSGPPTPPPVAVAGPTVSLSATTSSSRVALGSSTAGLNTVLVYNTGASTAYFTAGSASVVATTANTPVGPGACVSQWSGSNPDVAAITASGSASLLITQWNGAPNVSCPGGSGASGGSSVTITQSATSNPPVNFWITSATSATQMASHALTNGLVCIPLSTNTGTMAVGGSSVTTTSGALLTPLYPGVSLGISNSNLLYYIGTNTSDQAYCYGN